MKLLLHICCAPCANRPIAHLQETGHSVTGYWYNPNIHPFTEYRARRNTLVDYAGSIGLRLEMEDEYGLREFVRNVTPDFDRRCLYCYRVRMEGAARFAAQHGFDTFSSTLFVSPYQDHDLLRQAAEAAGEKYGVSFRYWDFSVRFREGQAKARELGLYMQKYCGCVFSEEERYRKKKKPKPAEGQE